MKERKKKDKHAYACTYARTYARTHARTHVRTHIPHTYTHTHVHTHTHKHTHAHTHIHTHTHAHTRTRSPKWGSFLDSAKLEYWRFCWSARRQKPQIWLWEQQQVNLSSPEGRWSSNFAFNTATYERTDRCKITEMRITYLDVTSVESGFEPPFSQMSSMEIMPSLVTSR